MDAYVRYRGRVVAEGWCAALIILGAIGVIWGVGFLVGLAF